MVSGGVKVWLGIEEPQVELFAYAEDFRGRTRTNDTHQPVTEPDARL